MKRGEPLLRRVGRLLPCAVFVLAALAFAGLAPLHGTSAHVQDQDQDEDARALLTAAAESMAGVTSFHFNLTTEGGTTTIMEELELETVEGDVVRPDRFQATVTAKLASFVSLDVHVVGIGDRIWVSDPMSDSGRWIEISVTDAEGGSLVDLVNPDRLLLQAVDLIENPEIAGTEEVEGVDTTRIEGTFDPRSLDIGTPVPEMITINMDPKPVAVWIDAEGRVLRLRVEGPMTAAEDADIVRTLHLSEFDAAVEITPPAGA